MMRADEQITADVVDQLVWDDRIDASKVAVTVDQGEVTLEGTVPTHTARWAAEDDARLVAGVRSVSNELSVDSLSASEVSVEEGRVILDGVVPNGVTQVAAHNAARYAAGVRDVDDRLVVSYQM